MEKTSLSPHHTRIFTPIHLTCTTFTGIVSDFSYKDAKLYLMNPKLQKLLYIDRQIDRWTDRRTDGWMHRLDSCCKMKSNKTLTKGGFPSPPLSHTPQGRMKSAVLAMTAWPSTSGRLSREARPNARHRPLHLALTNAPTPHGLRSEPGR